MPAFSAGIFILALKNGIPSVGFGILLLLVEVREESLFGDGKSCVEKCLV